MHLVYLDESGNSGLNLNDPQQPVFYLCAMVVAEDRWQSLELGLQRVLDARVPDWRSREGFEIHATDLRNGRGHFAGVPVGDRIALRDEWMETGAQCGVCLLGRSVQKKRFADWTISKFGPGVKISPHVAAFALLARGVDNYLNKLPGPPLGIFISDENKEIVAEIEKAIRLFRGVEGTLKLGRIVEKGFFIDSSKSLPLQLCDLFALSLRKSVEREKNLGQPKSVDDSGILAARKLLYQDYQHDSDVLEWLTSQGHERKKEAARG